MRKGIIMYFINTLCLSSEKKKHANKHNDAYYIGYDDNPGKFLAISADGEKIIKGKRAYNYPKEPIDMLSRGK
jgi:hypothetical protein